VGSGEFTDWQAFRLEEERAKWDRREKLDHYLAALRFDLNHILYVLRKFLGDSSAKPPELDKLYLDFGKKGQPSSEPKAEANKPVVPPLDAPPEEHHAAFENGYGMPGIDVGKEMPNEYWANVAQKQKSVYMSIFGDAIIEYTPGCTELGHGGESGGLGEGA
jgi:hypothetical protein